MNVVAWVGFSLSILVSAGSMALTVMLSRQVKELKTARPSSPAPHDDPRLPRKGTRLPEFAAQTRAGTPVTTADLGEGTVLLTFFSSGCGACGDQISLLKKVFDDDGEWSRWVAVVDGPDAESRAHYVGELIGYSDIIEGEQASAVQSLLGLDSWPMLVLLEHGRVKGAGRSVSMLEYVLGGSLTGR